jgi:hypothetical protein
MFKGSCEYSADAEEAQCTFNTDYDPKYPGNLIPFGQCYVPTSAYQQPSGF